MLLIIAILLSLGTIYYAYTTDFSDVSVTVPGVSVDLKQTSDPVQSGKINFQLVTPEEARGL